MFSKWFDLIKHLPSGQIHYNLIFKPKKSETFETLVTNPTLQETSTQES